MLRSLALLAVLSCLAAAATAAAPAIGAAPPQSAAEKPLPAAWDWRDVDGVDYLPPVRNTGSCGSSFIFGPVAVVEARYRIAATRLGAPMPAVDYSEQHIMACGTGYYGGFDCGGGYTKDVFTHIHDHGVPRDDCFLYVADDRDCPDGCPDSADELELHWPVDEIFELSAFPSEAEIMQQILDDGPVATTMDLYQDIYSYSSGVYAHYSGDLVGATVVMIVGWGEEGGVPCWICRNFWGEGWGDGGDLLVSRDAGHAGCDFGEWVWWCSIDESEIPVEPTSIGRLKSLYR